MKALNRAIERFCHNHRRFGIPRLMLYIVIISAGVFIIHMMDTTMTLLSLLSFHPGQIMRGEVWRLITWIFIPLNDNLFFTVIALYFYYFVGSTLEQQWGTAKFNVYYIFGVILHIVFGFIIWFVYAGNLDAGFLNFFWLGIMWLSPTYLNLSLFFAFAAIFPDVQIRLFFIIPIKVKWMALINAAFFLYSIISSAVGGNTSGALLPVVALFNFYIICGVDLLKHLRPARARVSPNTIKFKHAAKKAKREVDNKPYRHKCSVCGKTDTGYPDLEFRYCSRCDGYHCFCIEHINNHVHFQ